MIVGVEVQINIDEDAGPTVISGLMRIEVRIASGALCPVCKAEIRNFPEETARGWRLLCPNHHDFISAERL